MPRIDFCNATFEKSGCQIRARKGQLSTQRTSFESRNLWRLKFAGAVNFCANIKILVSYRLSLHPTGTPERIPLQNASSFAHHRRSNGSAASGDRFLKLPSTASTNNSSGTTTLIHQNGSSPSHSTNGNKNGNSPRTVFVTIHENEVTTKLLNSPNGSSASQRITSPMPVQA